jgi:hypothetical protein
MDRADKVKPRDPMNDVVFSGTPPPPLPKPIPTPEVRRDSLGRRISPTVLEALKATQFKPGTSGNPGGNFKRQREHALAVVVKLMKQGKLQPGDTVATFMNLLYDMDARAETPRQFLRALEKLNRTAERTLQQHTAQRIP